MASEKDATCANDPNFAIICAFFQKFSVILNMQMPDIHLLQKWLENIDEVLPGLKDLHIKLLRKLRKTVHEKSWESAIVKFCQGYSFHDSWEVERFGYKKCSLKVKLRILREILECQFERNTRFRNCIGSLTANDLRAQPIGRDKLGHAYYVMQDQKCNLRIYQEHLDEEIWQMVATNREELQSLIKRLKGNEVVLPSLVGVVDEDSSSNSCQVAVEKPPPPEEQDESESQEGRIIEEKVPNIKIKLGTCTIERSDGHRTTKLFKKELKKQKSDSEESAEEGVADDDDEGEEEDDEEEGEEEEEEEEEGEEEEDDEDEEEEAEEKSRELIQNNKQIEVDPEIIVKKKLEKVPVVDERRVKPIVINQAKQIICKDNEEDKSTKKRTADDDADKSSESNDNERIIKKFRPTLLDENHKRKISKYEKYSREYDDEEDDGDGDEEEGEEEEDDDSEPDQEEEDNDDDEGGEKDLVENNDNKVNLVGEAIEEKVLIVKGEGSGKDCEGSFLDFIQLGCENSLDIVQFDEGINPTTPIVGEAIEEEVILIFGEGSGASCLVGNTNDETDKKPVFFFGQPGCLKLSPIKKSETPPPHPSTVIPRLPSPAPLSKKKFANSEDETISIETKNNNNEDSHIEDGKELKNGEKCTKAAENIIAKESNTSSNNIEPLLSNEHVTDEKMKSSEKDTKSADDSKKNIPEEKCKTEESEMVDFSSNQHSSANNEIVEKTDGVEAVLICDAEPKKATVSQQKPQICAANAKSPIADNSLSELLNEKSDSLGKTTEDDNSSQSEIVNPQESPLPSLEDVLEKSDSTPIGSEKPVATSMVSRKRRLSDEKCDKFTISSESHSESDLNSENVDAVESDDDHDIGGKRIKIRPKIMHVDIRKRIEELRNYDKEESSSDDDRPRRHLQLRKFDSEKKQILKETEIKPEFVLTKSEDTTQIKNLLTEKVNSGITNTTITVVNEKGKKVAEISKLISGSADDKKDEKGPVKLEHTSKDDKIQDKIQQASKLEEVVAVKVKNELDVNIVEKMKAVSRRKTVEVCKKITRSRAAEVLVKETLTESSGEKDVKSEFKEIPMKMVRNQENTVKSNNKKSEKLVERREISLKVDEANLLRKEVKVKLKTEEISLTKVIASTEIVKGEKEVDEDKAVTEKRAKLSATTESEVKAEIKKESELEVKVEETIEKESLEEEEEVASSEDKFKKTTTKASARGRGGRRGRGRSFGKRRGRGGVRTNDTVIIDNSKKAKTDVEQEFKNGENKRPVKSEVGSIESSKPKIDDVDLCKVATAVKVSVPEENNKNGADLKNTVSLENVAIESSCTETTTGKSLPKKKQRSKKDIDEKNIIEVDGAHDVTPVRQSRRIAQLKIKEEAERRKLEEIALKKMKADLNKKKKEEGQTVSVKKEEIDLYVPSEEDEGDQESDVELKKKIEKKKKGKKKDGWTSGSEDEEEEDEIEFEHEHETDVGSPLFRSDHEFSPESDIEDESQAVPLKRARTARKEGTIGEVNVPENLDESCQKCGKNDHPEWILLCDKCDKGYHCSCLIPVLFIIPEGDWFCPPCEQEQLIEALEQHLKQYDELVRQHEIEEQQRLENLEMARRQAVKDMKKRDFAIKRRGSKSNRHSYGNNDDDDDDPEDSSRSSSSSSSSSSGSSSGTDSDDEPIYKLRKRRQLNVSYRFNEFDDLINSAIKDEMDEVAGAGNLGRGKDISTIIEADKEEKLRQRQREARLEIARAQRNESENFASKPPKDELSVENENHSNGMDASETFSTKNIIKDDESGSDFEPIKRKPKMSASQKKKNRKLNCLDISSEDDGSDEDFKTSSIDSDEEEESVTGPSDDSDSSLEVYRRKSKKNKKGRRCVRRAARERRKRFDDEFIVDDSEGSVDRPKIKKKRKDDSDYTESGTDDDEELSEDVDSEDLCDDTTDSNESDGAWRPSKRKKQKTAQSKKISQYKAFGQRKPKHKRKEMDEGEKSFKGVYSKKKRDFEDDDSPDGGPRTRGKRFTYLEDYEDDSSDDGIKPGVKRPDTPPEEREEFIRKQEEIKRLLAEKSAEAAKATSPREIPMPKPSDTLSTVPLSVIRGAKVLDIDYLQRKGELDIDPETEFDNDLPDNFNPEDMDEDEIAKMMEEEDFAQQQLKLAGEAIRQKKIREEVIQRSEPIELVRTVKSPPIQVQQLDLVKKRQPTPAIQSLLSNLPINKPPQASNLTPTNIMPPNRTIFPTMPLIMPPREQPLIPTTVLAVETNHAVIPMRQGTTAATSAVVGASCPRSLVSQQPIENLSSNSNISTNEASKPRGRRKKITPLRDTLQKQQAAAAAAAAHGPTNVIVAPPSKPISESPGISVIEKAPPIITASNLSVAQPPQLYKPSNTPPSVITRMPQPPPRPRYPDPGIGTRFYGNPNQLAAHRSPMRHNIPLPSHLTLRASYANGPPPLRPANSGPLSSVGNGIIRNPPPSRHPPAFSGSQPFPSRQSPHGAYRPPLFGTPGFPPAPSQPPASLHPPASDYQPPPFGSFFATALGSSHSTPPPPPPTASMVPNSVVLVATPSPPPVVTTQSQVLRQNPQQQQPPSQSQLQSQPQSQSQRTHSPAAQSEMEPLSPPPTRVTSTALETFDSKATPPLETESAQSPYLPVAVVSDPDEDSTPATGTITSEFSGLVSYFSSQQDDLNT